jgi:hypothetical protein
MRKRQTVVISPRRAGQCNSIPKLIVQSAVISHPLPSGGVRTPSVAISPFAWHSSPISRTAQEPAIITYYKREIRKLEEAEAKLEQIPFIPARIRSR